MKLSNLLKEYPSEIELDDEQDYKGGYGDDKDKRRNFRYHSAKDAGGLSFDEIGSMLNMSNQGAKNIFDAAMKKIAREFLRLNSKEPSDENVEKLVSNHEFHDFVGDQLEKLYGGGEEDSSFSNQSEIAGLPSK